MNTLLKKLNFKNQQTITIQNAPKEFESQLVDFKHFTIVKEAIDEENLEFYLVFVSKKTEVDAIVHKVAEKIKGDEIFWIAYPKLTSKNYRCDFNRDTGFGIIEKYGFETVRMVAIDEDWSAMRFRRAEFVKTKSRGSKNT